MEVFFKEALDRCFPVISHGDHDFSVLGRGLLADDDIVPVQDTGIDH